MSEISDLGSGIAAPASIGLGIIEAQQGIKGLKSIESTPYPQYSIAPQLSQAYANAQQMATGGFTGAETANFKQNVAQQQNTGYQQGIEQGGGNLAQALSAGFGAQRLAAFNSFAGQDASLHRQNIHYADTLANALQSQQNLIVGGQQSRRNALEKAYGSALAGGLSNITGALNLNSALNSSQNGAAGAYGANSGGNNSGLSDADAAAAGTSMQSLTEGAELATL